MAWKEQDRWEEGSAEGDPAFAQSSFTHAWKCRFYVMFSLLLQKLLLLTCAKGLQILLSPFLIWRKSCLLFSLKYLKSLKFLHFHLFVPFRKWSIEISSLRMFCWVQGLLISQVKSSLQTLVGNWLSKDFKAFFFLFWKYNLERKKERKKELR